MMTNTNVDEHKCRKKRVPESINERLTARVSADFINYISTMVVWAPKSTKLLKAQGTYTVGGEAAAAHPNGAKHTPFGRPRLVRSTRAPAQDAYNDWLGLRPSINRYISTARWQAPAHRRSLGRGAVYIRSK